MPKLKSPIWQHFTPLNSENKVKCVYCSQQLSVSNKSTCNLLRHFSKKHPTLSILRRHSSSEARSQEVLLVNDDTDANPDSPEAPILRYETEETDIEDSESDNFPSRIITKDQRSDNKSSDDTFIKAVTEARNQIAEAMVSLRSYTNKRRTDEDEYDYFGHIIASKIRKIQDVEKREVVMHSVYNVVYEALMKNI